MGHRWFGYGPCKPVMVGKLLDIFRVFYNIVEVGRNKQTPGMRLGLAKGKITVENIIYLLSVAKLLRIFQSAIALPFYFYITNYSQMSLNCSYLL